MLLPLPGRYFQHDSSRAPLSYKQRLVFNEKFKFPSSLDCGIGSPVCHGRLTHDAHRHTSMERSFSLCFDGGLSEVEARVQQSMGVLDFLVLDETDSKIAS